MKLLNKNTKLNNRGFSHIEVIIVIVVVVVIAAVGVLVYKNDDDSNTAHAGSWRLLASSTNKETTESVYACRDKVSSGTYHINMLATLSPAVKDSSKYTAGIITGEGRHGGASTTFIWYDNNTSRTWAGLVPNPNLKKFKVTPTLTAPKNDPFIKGGGGGAVTAFSLPKC